MSADKQFEKIRSDTGVTSADSVFMGLNDRGVRNKPECIAS
jgi:hypothetical protein